MIGLIILFLVLAIISGSLGFAGVSIISIELTKMLFFIFLALFVLSLIVHAFSNNQPKR